MSMGASNAMSQILHGKSLVGLRGVSTFMFITSQVFQEYHAEMNSDVFIRSSVNKLIPALRHFHSFAGTLRSNQPFAAELLL